MTHRPVPSWLFPLFAFACAVLVANLYYAQPLIGPISAALGLAPEKAGLIVTVIQAGYGLGLLLVVPAGDLVENRRLIVSVTLLSVLALLALGLAASAPLFLLAAFFLGVSSVSVQVIVPFAAYLAPAAERGRVVGSVMGGLMLGIMLARPVSSFLADLFGWRAVFFISAGVTAAMSLFLARVLPPRRPSRVDGYGALIASMGRLLLTTPVLQRRAVYQALQFAAFSLFWTVTPLLLAGPAFGLSQRGIALFALAGVAGAVAAPIAGRLADRGLGRAATFAGLAIPVFAFLLSRLVESGMPALALLTIAAVLLDFGVSMTLVVGQRAIYALGDAIRARLNGLFIALFFAGGAVGSALGAYAFEHGGWPLASGIGMALPLAALLFAFTERRSR